MRFIHGVAVAALFFGAAFSGSAVAAAGTEPADWAAKKCQLYTEAWLDVAARRGTADLSETFLADHQAFLSSACKTGRSVCPQSDAEIEVANLMTVLIMNEGAASTFPPFVCGNR